MKPAAGIIIGVRENDQPAVLLQRRKSDDSFANGSQVSAHGKLTEEEITLPESERFYIAMLRKVAHELGPRLAELVTTNREQLEIIHHEQRPDKEVLTYGLDTKRPAAEVLEMIQLGGDAGGIFPCSDPSQIRTYKDGEKQSGVPHEEIAMFPDEIQSVKTFLGSIIAREA